MPMRNVNNLESNQLGKKTIKPTIENM